MMLRLILPILVIFTVVPTVSAEEYTFAGVRVETSIVYGKGGDTELHLDLYTPEEKEGNGPLPGLICLHGGAWRSGSYRDLYMLAAARELARRGYVVANVQYRLVPKAVFPAQIEDCKCAVRWLRTNAKKYHVDPDRIGALGFSAGGHLACLLGLTYKDDGFEGKGGCDGCSSQVQAVVDFFGPSDLRGGDWPGQTTLKELLGGTVAERPEEYAKASPIMYVKKDRAAPPFLILHGTKDHLVQYKHSVRLAEALKEIGGQATLITMEGEGHGWPAPKMQQSLNDTVQFLDKQLKPKPAENTK